MGALNVTPEEVLTAYDETGIEPGFTALVRGAGHGTIQACGMGVVGLQRDIFTLEELSKVAETKAGSEELYKRLYDRYSQPPVDAWTAGFDDAGNDEDYDPGGCYVKAYEAGFEAGLRVKKIIAQRDEMPDYPPTDLVPDVLAVPALA